MQVGYAPEYFRPRVADNRFGWEYCTTNGSDSRYEAFVDVESFLSLFRLVLQGKWQLLAQMYARQLKANPDPRNLGARRGAAAAVARAAAPRC